MNTPSKTATLLNQPCPKCYNSAYASVAQGTEHRSPKAGAARSNRAGGTTKHQSQRKLSLTFSEYKPYKIKAILETAEKEKGMQGMYQAKDYLYQVFWSEEDNGFIATVTEFPKLSSVENTPESALRGMIDRVADTLEEMKETGEVPPMPLAKKEYSGNIRLRMPKEQHRRVATEAAEQGVSINQLLVSRI